MSIKREINSNFFLLADFESLLKKELGPEFHCELLEKLIRKSLIVTVTSQGEKYIHKDELSICKDLMRWNDRLSGKAYVWIGESESLWSDIIQIGRQTYFCYPVQETKKEVPVFVRNILHIFRDQYEECQKKTYHVLGIMIITCNRHIASYIENVMYRKYRLDKLKTSNFANTSAYMGSKKKIVGFIVEAIWPHVDQESVVLDIMCGSGAVSGALAQMNHLYASDAQLFCRLLAKIQGAGFREQTALELLNELYPHYKQNFQSLHHELETQLQLEKNVFHLDIRNPELVFMQYQEYVEHMDLYSSTERTAEAVLRKIQERKQDHQKFPYCLFTYYFSNVYFGLEQCMQIDSIRYSLDQLKDENLREWGLGVLIATVSAIASNHAGHFAQPKRVDEKSIVKIIESRRKSAWLEFSKRLMAVAEESERYDYRIQLVEGPWKEALKQMSDKQFNNLVVYLDAPYKRDEYSRYYHVLETVALYDYPASERKGRLRSKQNGERFKTEFFSKNTRVVEEHLKQVIVSVLEVGKVCAWSYSDNGMASIPQVVDKVQEEVPCKVFFYRTSHKHLSQRKKSDSQETSSMAVIEYCIVFVKE